MRIKVTTFIETDDIDDDQIDLDHATGLTEEAFTAYVTGDRALFCGGDSSFVLQRD